MADVTMTLVPEPVQLEIAAGVVFVGGGGGGGGYGDEEAVDAVAAAMVGGANVSVDYDDPAGRITVAVPSVPAADVTVAGFAEVDQQAFDERIDAAIGDLEARVDGARTAEVFYGVEMTATDGSAATIARALDAPRVFDGMPVADLLGVFPIPPPHPVLVYSGGQHAIYIFEPDVGAPNGYTMTLVRTVDSREVVRSLYHAFAPTSFTSSRRHRLIGDDSPLGLIPGHYTAAADSSLRVHLQGIDDALGVLSPLLVQSEDSENTIVAMEVFA